MQKIWKFPIAVSVLRKNIDLWQNKPTMPTKSTLLHTKIQRNELDKQKLSTNWT